MVKAFVQTSYQFILILKMHLITYNLHHSAYVSQFSLFRKSFPCPSPTMDSTPAECVHNMPCRNVLSHNPRWPAERGLTHVYLTAKHFYQGLCYTLKYRDKIFRNTCFNIVFDTPKADKDMPTPISVGVASSFPEFLSEALKLNALLQTHTTTTCIQISMCCIHVESCSTSSGYGGYFQYRSLSIKPRMLFSIFVCYLYF